MKTLDFTIYTDTSSIQDDSFVTLQAGKGKHLYNKIVLRRDEFSFIEGILWDKHREYGNNIQTKINAIDWHRISEGFHDAMTELASCTSEEDLVDILSLRNHHNKELLSEVTEDTSILISFIKEIDQWIQNNTPKKHIL